MGLDAGKRACAISSSSECTESVSVVNVYGFELLKSLITYEFAYSMNILTALAIGIESIF